jgi:hypothetical protein
MPEPAIPELAGKAPALGASQGKGNVFQADRISVVDGPEHLGREGGIGLRNGKAAKAQPRFVFLQGDSDPAKGKAASDG